MSVRLIIIATPSTLSEKLAELQNRLRGQIPSGPKIRWDSRVDTHPDFLADDKS